MPYTTEAKIENYLATDINNNFSGQIDDWIAAVEAYINKYCNRPDGFIAGNGTRYYEGEGTRELLIDSFTSLTSVQIMEQDGVTVNQTLSTDDYWAYPLNTTPKYKLVLTPNSSLGVFPRRKSSVKVVGSFGFADTSVPKDIELAATMLVAKIIEKGLKGGQISSESLGDYSVTYANITEADNEIGATKLLSHYRIYTV